MYMQGVDNIFDLHWNNDVCYRELYHQAEVEWSIYNFEEADRKMLFRHFDECEQESQKMIKRELVLPAYDYCLKCSHLFNLLDARKAISVSERVKYIARVRALARQAAELYLRKRYAKEFPMLAEVAQKKSALEEYAFLKEGKS
jgi:glycyl-tRNA synthetase alpha chain